VRLAGFVDVGNVFDDVDNFKVGELRYSVGISGLWLSPLGPLSLSVAAPLNKDDDDETEVIQFSFGAPF
jgi:outer membrane protein insertion porin family